MLIRGYAPGAIHFQQFQPRERGIATGLSKTKLRSDQWPKHFSGEFRKAWLHSRSSNRAAMVNDRRVFHGVLLIRRNNQERCAS